jgi:hypothetical protein
MLTNILFRNKDFFPYFITHGVLGFVFMLCNITLLIYGVVITATIFKTKNLKFDSIFLLSIPLLIYIIYDFYLLMVVIIQ